jgi:hypothetical protein
MKEFKTINQNKADIEIGYKEQKQHLIDIMKSDEESGLYDEPKFVTVNMESATGEDLGRVSYIPIPNVDYIPKQETLEEAAENHLQKWRLLNNIHLSNILHAERCKNDFIAGAKWQQERMYSEEEVIAFGEFIFKHSLLTHTRGVKSLFEQFKNK